MQRRAREQGGPTIAEVARAAGVSPQTVSNALNAPHRLRPETLANVLHVVDALGYRPNRAAQSLRTQASRQIGYRILPDRAHTASVLMDRFLHALADAAQESGYFLLLFTARDTAEELATYAELIRAGSVDGFVLSDINSDDARPAALRSLKAPFVSFGRMDNADNGLANQFWVDVDGAAGTEAATEHLVSRGHRRIAFLGMRKGFPPADRRVEGWRRVLRRRGLTSAGFARSADTIPDATDAAARLLDVAPRPTAIVAANDTLALGCYLAARQRRLTVGRDLAVTGFDDSPIGQLASPPLTSIAQPVTEIGKTVISMLVDRLTDRDPEARSVLLAPTLIVRDSTATRTAMTRN